MGKRNRKKKYGNQGLENRTQGVSESSEPGLLASSKEGLYSSVLEEMERSLLKRARDAEGLDEEIALLRVKLASALAREPENTELLFKGMTVLIRGGAAKARYSPQADAAHYKKMRSVLEGLGKSLFNVELPSGDEVIKENEECL